MADIQNMSLSVSPAKWPCHEIQGFGVTMVSSDMIMDGSVPLEAMRVAVGVGQHTE